MSLSHHEETHLEDIRFYIIFVFEGNGDTENKKRDDSVEGLLASDRIVGRLALSSAFRSR